MSVPSLVWRYLLVVAATGMFLLLQSKANLDHFTSAILLGSQAVLALVGIAGWFKRPRR